MATYALGEKAVLLRSEDDVAVAKAELPAGTILEDGGTRIEVRQDIKPGHKVARHAVATGAPVRRYGQVIGFATRPSGGLLSARAHAHLRRLQAGRRARGHAQLRGGHLGRELLGEREPVREGPLPRRPAGLSEHRRGAGGHAQVRVRHDERTEVSDSVGSE